METLTQSTDLVADAPNFQAANVECDALSVGLGFEVKPTGTPGPKQHALDFGNACP